MHVCELHGCRRPAQPSPGTAECLKPERWPARMPEHVLPVRQGCAGAAAAPPCRCGASWAGRTWQPRRWRCGPAACPPAGRAPRGGEPARGGCCQRPQGRPGRLTRHGPPGGSAMRWQPPAPRAGCPRARACARMQRPCQLAGSSGCHASLPPAACRLRVMMLAQDRARSPVRVQRLLPCMRCQRRGCPSPAAGRG